VQQKEKKKGLAEGRREGGMREGGREESK